MPARTSQQLKQVGLTLRELRMELGLSQEKLGELAGVQQSEVSRIEAGSVNLSFDGLSKIARACGITVAELMARAKV